MAAHEKWMPLYVGDYLADTMHLTARQHGAYLLLLMHAWRSQGAVPDDHAALAAIARMSAKDWAQDKGPVMAFFDPEEGGWWVHRRVQKELGVARAVTEQRSKAGKASAAKRERERQQESNGNPTPVEHPLPSRAIPSPSPSPLPDNSEAKASGAKAPAREVIFQEGLPWLMRRSGLPDRQCRTIIGKWLSEFGDDAVLAALTQAEQENPVDPIPWIVAKFKPRETWNERRIRLGMEAIHS